MQYLKLTSYLTIAFALSACGGGSDNNSTTSNTSETPKPATYIPSQYQSLRDNFKYVSQPLTEIKNNNLYDFSF